MRRHWHHSITNNLNYKLIALFISLILWMTILGRRDFVQSKNVDVDLQVSAEHILVAQTADHIKVKVSGPRAALKKFIENPSSISIDISQKGEGLVDVDIPNNKIEIPFGVKILGVRPNVIRAEVVKKVKDK